MYTVWNTEFALKGVSTSKKEETPTISLKYPDKRWKPPKKGETPQGVSTSANSVVHTVSILYR